MQPIGEATGEEEEEEEEEEDESVGEIAYEYLNKPDTDKTFGVRKIGKHHYIGNKHVIIKDDNIIIKEDGDKFIGTDGLWELITSTDQKKKYEDEDLVNYGYLMIKTNALYRAKNPNNPNPRSNRSNKWKNILGPIWHNREKYEKKKGYDGEGVVVIPSDPNALLERLNVLFASQEAGHTGVVNELVSICDE